MSLVSVWESLPLAIAFVVVVFGMPISYGVLLSWFARRGRPFRQRWADRLAKLAGGTLTVTPGGDFSLASAEGEVDGSAVRVSAFASVSGPKRGILVNVRVDTRTPLSATQATWPRFAGPQTGDASFDAEVDIAGDPAFIAALSGELRSEIRALTGDGAVLRSGVWVIEDDKLFQSDEALETAVLRLLALGAAMRAALSAPEPPPTHREPISGLRATESAER